jgi:hypothetical protein
LSPPPTDDESTDCAIGGNVELAIEVGTEQKHQLRLSVDKVPGQVRIEVDGNNVAQGWRPFSLHKTRLYELTVGGDQNHDVIIELSRKAVVGGFRSQTCRVLVDGDLVATYVGRPAGKASKAA